MAVVEWGLALEVGEKDAEIIGELGDVVGQQRKETTSSAG